MIMIIIIITAITIAASTAATGQSLGSKLRRFKNSFKTE